MCDSFLVLYFQQFLTMNLSECVKSKNISVENKELMNLYLKRVAHWVYSLRSGSGLIQDYALLFILFLLEYLHFVVCVTIV